MDELSSFEIQHWGTRLWVPWQHAGRSDKSQGDFVHELLGENKT